MPKLTKTDEYYLQIADAVSIKSKCLKKHYGAIIIKNNEIISTGFNGPARGEDHCVKCTKVGSDKDMIEYSSCPAIHAEMNCIISASRQEMLGSTLYLSGRDVSVYLSGRYASGAISAIGLPIAARPCEICLRLIKNAGIEKVINKNGVIYQRDSEGILREVKND